MISTNLGPIFGPLPTFNPLFVLSPSFQSETVFPVQSPKERICMVTVAIGPGRLFSGIGNTFAQAKANAAAQCLGFLGPHIQALDAKLRMDEQKRKCAQQKPPLLSQPNQLLMNVVDNVVDKLGASCERDPIPKHKQKSVISQVHECALQMKLNVEFEDMKMDPTYGHQINPISRLIQVLQARCENEPQFELVSEQGQSRYKEFTVQVSCGSRICCGSGPNKRLAKRAAAEAMLAEIGYVKPLPPPGKSLLKKKMDSQLNIELFDPNNLVSSSNEVLLHPDAKTYQQTSQNKDENLLQEGILSLNMNDYNTQESRCDAISISSTKSEIQESPGNIPQSPGRRRVTFSNQVKACPPPDDSNYPEPEVAPLKADVLIGSRVKRIRRSKEAKRALSDQQKFEIREIARASMQALQGSSMISCAEGANDSETCQSLSAKRHLEIMSETFKFSVQYTNFPKVCHGRGSTMETAVDNAAFNAISSLCTYDQPSIAQERTGAVAPNT
ncbi:hypothetical protein DICVIV_02852 [Dictyocaulus viviparus]|uniref:DRBM domain-containing protein n=1 Tax=Dictyocaulus viviparus TaxID=29172 RepID=A0A0D8Y4Q9_DICVI|nr:hypothetical protein DICVIV_02852 [Dictyocaulus viviparus]